MFTVASPHKKMGSKKQKKNNLPGATPGTRQRNLKKNKKILCRVPSSPGTRQRPVTKKAGPSKEAFAGCQVMGHPAKKFKKN